MVAFDFSYADLEYFLLILVRVSCFVFIAPFFAQTDTPRLVRVALSVFTSVLLYNVLTPTPDTVVFETSLSFAAAILLEGIAGILIGFAANICTSIVSFAGSITDMDTGLSMVTVMDPTSREQVSITGVYYRYILMMILIASGMYRYLLGAIADSFVLIPVGGVHINTEHLVAATIRFLGDYIVIGFRICLPVFCATLLLNVVLGVLAKVSPQLNMFAVGIQFKIIVGLAVLYLSSRLLSGVSDMIFTEIRQLTVDYTGAMLQ